MSASWKRQHGKIIPFDVEKLLPLGMSKFVSQVCESIYKKKELFKDEIEIK